MSWLRSAVNRAVEAGGSSHIRRAVLGYADSVVGQAVIGGTKFLQDREGALNFQNFKLAVKRLEEASMSCRGIERIQILRRWLVALKVLEGDNQEETSGFQEKYDESSLKPSEALYYDPELGEQRLNFRDVFLHSQALEGMTLSLILEEPNEEELSLLMEIFRVCLTGNKEILDVAFTSVRDMARAFSTYSEEVLAKREELLQCVQYAITGLKANAEIERIDSEVSSIHKQLEDKKSCLLPIKSDNPPVLPLENLKEAIAYIRLSSRLEELLLKKKHIQKGDPPEARNAEIDKLKVLTESLACSALKAEKRVSELRTQKEEALKFRVAKTSEVSLLQQEFMAEINALEKRKIELEEELRKVTLALITANARLRNAREERDQFDEASNQMIQHFKSKDDDLSKSIGLYKAEENVCSKFVNFLESTWIFHALNVQQKDKLVNDELERDHDNFVDLAATLLDAYKEEFRACISSTSQLVDNLKRLDESNIEEGRDAVNTRKLAIEQYLDTKTKVETIISLGYSIKKRISCNKIKDLDGVKVMELVDVLEKMKTEFESLDKHVGELEGSIKREEMQPKARTPRIIPFLSRQLTTRDRENLETDSAGNMAPKGIVLPFNPTINLPFVGSLETTQLEGMEALGATNDGKINAEAQLSKLKLELEQESHSRGNSMDGIIDWEFDEKVEKTMKNS